MYVTVFVITCLTLTGLCVHDLDPSKDFGFPSTQSAGENGERWALLNALLLGESVTGDQAGDCGIRSLRRRVGVRAEFGGRMNDEGGIMGAESALEVS